MKSPRDACFAGHMIIYILAISALFFMDREAAASIYGAFGWLSFQAVRRVLPRLLRAAKAEVSHLEASQADGTAETLRRARQRLEAWADDGFLLADVNSPNAFVTPVLPRVLFVHRGVFQVQRLMAPDTLEVGKEVYVHREGWQRAKLLAEKGAAWNALLEDASEALVRQEERSDLAALRCAFPWFFSGF